MVYAVAIVAGGLTPCITGMVCKIVPFLTWLRAYGPHVGHWRTPPAASLGSARLETAGFTLQAAAAGFLGVGAWLLDDTILRVAAWMLAAAVLLLAGDMFLVVRHLWRPRLAPLARAFPPVP